MDKTLFEEILRSKLEDPDRHMFLLGISADYLRGVADGSTPVDPWMLRMVMSVLEAMVGYHEAGGSYGRRNGGAELHVAADVDGDEQRPPR